MNRSVLMLAVLCTLALATATPSATAQPIYMTAHSVQITPAGPSIPAGETEYAVLEVESACSLGYEIRPERMGPEQIFLSVKTSHPALSAHPGSYEYEIDWSEHCVLGNHRHYFAMEVELTLAEDAPDATTMQVHVELESSWDSKAAAEAQYKSVTSGGLATSIPEAVLLANGQGTVSVTLTNDGSTDLQVALDPSLRTLFGAQPDVQTITLAPGGSQTVDIPVSVQDDPGALGALLVEIRGTSAEDPDQVVHDETYRIPLEVSDGSGTLSESVEEAPVPAGGLFAVALAGLAFVARRRFA